MTRQRALRLAREWSQGHVCSLRDGEAAEYHSMFAAMLEEAPPNEPLKLEQLREMEDEPAYLNVFDPLLKSGWHIIKAVTEDKIIFRGWEKVYVPIDGMGIDYNLYRRPPEGDA